MSNYALFLISFMLLLASSCRKREQYFPSDMPTFVHKKLIYDYKDSTGTYTNAMKVDFEQNLQEYNTDAVYYANYTSLDPSLDFYDIDFYPTNIKVTYGAIHSIETSSNMLFSNTYTVLFLPFVINPNLLHYDINLYNGSKGYIHTIIVQDSLMQFPFGETRVHVIQIESVHDKTKKLIYYNRTFGIVKNISPYNPSTPSKQKTFTLRSME